MKHRHIPTRAEVAFALDLIPKKTKFSEVKVMADIKPVVKSLKGVFQSWDTPGTQVTGRIVRRDYVDLKEGASLKYLLEGENGVRVSFLAPMQVAEALDGVPGGTYVEVEYQGEEKGTNGRKYKNFDIRAEDYTQSNVDPDTGEIFN